MKIFVGYGYNKRDEWIKEYVFPVIEAFGDEVVTGGKLHGEIITEAIRQKIAESDALIGFLTRRGDADSKGVWKTHRWVIDEITTAINSNIPVLEVREKGVDDQGGIAGDRQRIEYEEGARDKLLVELTTTLGNWHSFEDVKLKLLPDECVQELIPLLRSPDLRCGYKIMSIRNKKTKEFKANIVPVNPGGLFVFAQRIPRYALIQVQIEHKGTHWSSSFETIDSFGVHLRKE